VGTGAVLNFADLPETAPIHVVSQVVTLLRIFTQNKFFWKNRLNNIERK